MGRPDQGRNVNSLWKYYRWFYLVREISDGPDLFGRKRAASIPFLSLAVMCMV
jgi:hypothetical protein